MSHQFTTFQLFQEQVPELGDLPVWQTLGLGVPDHVLTMGEAEAVAALEVEALR